MIKYNIPSKDEMKNDDFKSKVAIMGVGSAGLNIIDRIAIIDDKNIDLIAVDSDIRSLNSSVCKNKIQLGENVTKGLGTGGDPDIGKRSVYESEDQFIESLKQTDMLFIISGLGGGTSSGAVPRIAEIAYSNNIFVVSVMIIPFSFEGTRRNDQALEALEQIKNNSNALLIFDNDKMGSLTLATDGVQKAFKATEILIYQSVKSIIDIISKPNALIKISVADILATLKSNDSRCLFGYGESSGKKRTTSALTAALKSPLLDKGEILKYAKNVIIHISGGESTTLDEIENVMSEIKTIVNPEAQIYLGLTTDPLLKEKFCLTILSSLSAEKLTENNPTTQIEKKIDSQVDTIGQKKVSTGKITPIIPSTISNNGIDKNNDEEVSFFDDNDEIDLPVESVIQNLNKKPDEKEFNNITENESKGINSQSKTSKVVVEIKNDENSTDKNISDHKSEEESDEIVKLVKMTTQPVETISKVSRDDFLDKEDLDSDGEKVIDDELEKEFEDEDRNDSLIEKEVNVDESESDDIKYGQSDEAIRSTEKENKLTESIIDNSSDDISIEGGDLETPAFLRKKK